jgi:hypothetical protein
LALNRHLTQDLVLSASFSCVFVATSNLHSAVQVQPSGEDADSGHSERENATDNTTDVKGAFAREKPKGGAFQKSEEHACCDYH